MMATEDNYTMPNKIVSDEYITIEGEKLSKSKGNYIALKDLLSRYPADAIRYYFLTNDPEKRDFNFTWTDFINTLNSDLLGKWGNFINRTLVFINKSFDGKLNEYEIDSDLENQMKNLYEEVGTTINDGNVKEGLHLIFDFIGKANKYFDEQKPWELAKTNPEECQKVLFNCTNIIYNVNNLLKPYIPFSCEKVDTYLNQQIETWEYKKLSKLTLSEDIKPLYQRYDKSVIEEEKNRLRSK